MRHRATSNSRAPALAVLTAIFLGGCDVGEARLEGDLIAAPSTPLPVETAQAHISDLFAQHLATANIGADGEAQVPARVAGEVIETLVEEGDRVKQGQILARIDGERLHLRLLRSRALLAERRSEYRRQRELHERGLVSRASFENLKFEVDELRAAYDIDRLNFGYTAIRAPINGVVAARYIRTGQHVGSGDLAFRISDTSKLVASLLLPQRDLARFRAGQQALLTVDAWPGIEFTAEIVRLSPTIDERNGSVRATACIDNSDGLLAPGMFGRFHIRYEKYPQSLSVPAKSVADEDGESVVYRVRDGKAQRQVVTIGIVVDGRAQILSGLQPGDEVIVSGTGGLEQGAEVLASNSGQSLHSG